MRIPFFKISLFFAVASVAALTLWVNQVHIFHDLQGLEKSYPYMIGFYGFLFISIASVLIGIFRTITNKNDS